MERFVVILVLAGLLWQQGACCCGETRALGWTTSEPAAPHAACCDHAGDSGCEAPGQPGRHTHHICVGSHIFFLVDHQVPALDEASLSATLDLPAPMPALAERPSAVAHFRYLSQRPATSALPLRAALQVFLI